MKLRSVTEILPNTRVILRMDLDLPILNGKITDDTRLIKSIPTLKLLLSKGCKIAIIGHRGRPEGHQEDFSLRPIYLELMTLLEPNGENLIDSVFVDEIGNRDLVDRAMAMNHIVFLENLRFWKGEENNDSDFLKNLVEINQYYVNDAITVSHRKHKSIMLFKQMPGFYGLAFIEEVEKMSKIAEDPDRPLTIILGGAKADKLEYLKELNNLADHILVGGKLPLLINDKQAMINDITIMAQLREDGFDLSDEDIANFKEVINISKSIVWAGAMGWFEKDDCRKGTEEIAKSIANSNAYKIIAGGDTGASIINLGLKEKIDFICSGGGVMLYYLANKELPAWS